MVVRGPRVPVRVQRHDAAAAHLHARLQRRLRQEHLALPAAQLRRHVTCGAAPVGRPVQGHDPRAAARCALRHRRRQPGSLPVRPGGRRQQPVHRHLLELHCSMVKAAPWQCPSSPPVPPQGAPGGFGQLGTPRARGRAIGRPATASAARASHLQSRPSHPFQALCGSPSSPA